MWQTMDKRKKAVSFFVLALAILNLVIVDVKTIQSVANKTTETYCVLGEKNRERHIKKTTLDTTFVPVQKELKKIALCGTFHISSGDTLGYSIQNGEGKEVFFKRNVRAEDIYNIQNDRLELPVSDLSFDTGETYQLKVSFDFLEKSTLSVDKNGIVNVQEYPVLHQWLLYAILIGFNVLAAIFFLLILKHGFSNRIFFSMLLTVGLLSALLSIPFSRDDELRHFIRVYDLATAKENFYYGVAPEEVYGVIELSSEQEAPYVKVPAELDEMRRLAHDNNVGDSGYLAETNNSLCVPKLLCMLQQEPKQGEVWMSASAVWGRPLLAYLPQVVMVWLGNLFGARMFSLYIMAKIGQVLAVAFLYYLSVRMIPQYKEAMALLALLPHNVVLYASCNSDGLMIASVMLGIAMVLYAKEKQISWITPKGILYWGMFLFLQFDIFEMKMPYVLIGIGLLPILFFDKRSKKEWMAVAFLFVLAVFILWIKRDWVSLVLQTILPQQYLLFWKENMGEVTNRFLHKGWSLLKETKTVLRENSMVSYVGFSLVMTLFMEKRAQWKEKIYLAVLFFVMLGVIVVYGYTLSPLDAPVIVGVSNRYLLPILPLFLFTLPMGNARTKQAVSLIMPICLVSMLFAAMFTFSWF